MTDSNTLTFVYNISADDFTRAGEASSDVKQKLKQLGINPAAVRKVAIAMYEGEINMFIQAEGGEITVTVSPTEVVMLLEDGGPGIPDVEKALTAGYSTAPSNIRGLGFGAGMGLPNMKKNSDFMEIHSEVGVGTTVHMIVYLS